MPCPVLSDERCKLESMRRTLALYGRPKNFLRNPLITFPIDVDFLSIVQGGEKVRNEVSPNGAKFL
jgi:hypothetical protein